MRGRILQMNESPSSQGIRETALSMHVGGYRSLQDVSKTMFGAELMNIT